MQRFPRTAEFPHLRGLAYFRAGDLRSAETDLVDASRLAPGDTDTHFDLGLVLMAARRYAEAASHFEQSLKDPSRATDALPHLLLGRAYQNSNRSELAIEQFKRALQVDPSAPLAHFHLGFAYESLGRNQEALTEYEKELARTRDNAEVFYQYGNTLTEMGRYPEAIPQLEKALELKADHADAEYDLGKCLLMTGKADAATAALRRSIALNAADPSPHYLLAKALLKTGDRAESQKEMSIFSRLRKQQQESG